MPMCKYLGSLFLARPFHLSFCSINDITVPYVTAAIETQDPFINSNETGIEM